MSGSAGPGLVDQLMVARRIGMIFRLHLNEQLALVDATAHEIALEHQIALGLSSPPASEDFVTAPLPDSAIEDILDLSDDPLRVAVLPALEQSERAFQHRGAGDGKARRDETVELDVLICASDPGTVSGEDPEDDDWTELGALWRCMRVERAVVGVLARYPTLPLKGAPGGDVPGIASDVAIGKTGRRRSAEQEDDPTSLVELVVPLLVRMIRTIRTS